jgi:hypothetical protein
MTMASDEAIGESRLHVAVPAAVSRERARDLLGDGRDAWLGERVADAGSEVLDGASVRHVLDLELRVSDHAPRVAFHKAAFVDVGQLRDDGDGSPLSLDLSWRAAGMTPLFPVFAGSLSWNEGELLLDGYYAPPGGRIGEMADRLLLNVAARATGRRLLERVAERMTSGD